LAPEVVCAIVEQLLSPALVGLDFEGTPSHIAQLWERMYSTMRVRGHSGGFMLDAMSGVDIALWDLAGLMADKPVCELLSNSPKRTIPAYLSGTSGSCAQECADFASRYADEGINLVKLYYESDWNDLLDIADKLPQVMCFGVDALWHLPPKDAVSMALELDARNARWLECPLYPEEVEAHAVLAAAVKTPIAIGESYRSLHELRPFLGIAKIIQPDLGRCGITGSMRIAEGFAGEIVPHLSIAMGPQIAAAIHFAAAASHCNLCEFNPNVLDTANAFLENPLVREGAHYKVPQGPGLGIEWSERHCEVLAFQ
jgi:galactonate dehydratase